MSMERHLANIARRAGMEPGALRKIANGHIRNPGIDTVAKFWPHLVAMERAQAVLEAATPRPPSPGAPP